MLFTSCKREFDHDPVFKSNDPVEVLGDNTLLFSKMFQIESNSAYLWFDIRNEIANYSSPFLGQGFVENGIERYKRIDLRGRIYEYKDDVKELTILDYPFDMVTGSDLPANIVYSFDRKQKSGCELISDEAQRRRCETTFTLQLKKIEFKEIGLVLEVDIESNYNGKTLKISEMKQDVMLIN